MPNFTPTPVAGGGVIDPDAIVVELEAIAAAHNTHAAGDFPADCVPLAALVNDYAATPIDIGVQGAQAGAIVMLGTPQTSLVIPYDCTLIAVSAVVSVIGGAGAGGSVNLYHETDAVYVLGSDLAIPVALTAYSDSAPAKTDLTAGDVLTVRLAVAAGESITSPNLTLWVKAQHTT